MDELFWSSLRLATPLVFAALAGLLSERAGVVNLALEGFLLVGAFVGASTAFMTGSMLEAWVFASIAGVLLSTVFAFLIVTLKGSPVIIATAINLLVFGLIPLTSKYLFNSTGSTPVVPMELRLQNFPMILMVGVTLAIYLYGRFTLRGLYWRTAGESAFSLEAAGISVNKTRFIHLMLAGLVASWGGVSLSLFLSSSYSPLMSGGRGFIALAALILGRWKPWLVFASCLLFGFFEALQMRLQGLEQIQVPLQMVQILPYVLTILVLIAFKDQKSAPQELTKVTT
ncbi:MAG: ABC transporter permease [Bdellovibrionota bacterium]